MYKGNPRLRSSSEVLDYTDEQLLEWEKCATDFEYFAENYAFINTLDYGLQKINFRDYQKRMIATIREMNNNPKKKGMIVLAPRQCGKTTGIQLYLLWSAVFFDSKRIAIIANKAKNAMKVLEDIKKAYELLPLWMQVGVENGGWNKGEIILGNGSKITTGATSSDSIRGGTFNLVYLDEFAFVPKSNADDFMRSVFPTIMSGKTAKLIVTSTPKGMGNRFYSMWKTAEAGDSMYLPVRVHWREVPYEDDLDEFKKKIIRSEGITSWVQEFECKFIGSAKTLIPMRVLEDAGGQYDDPIFSEWDDRLQIFEDPIPNVRYVLGVDTGQGVGGDYSVIQVIKINSITEVKQVARFSDNLISPTEFGDAVIELSKYYNGAELMIENNDIGHFLCGYIWWERDYDKIVNFEKNVLGIRSSRRTKLQANMALREYLANGYLELPDEKTWGELMVYEEVAKEIYRGASGHHDDLVTSLIWAIYYLKASDDMRDEYKQPTATKFTLSKNRVGTQTMPFVPEHSGEPMGGPQPMQNDPFQRGPQLARQSQENPFGFQNDSGLGPQMGRGFGDSFGNYGQNPFGEGNSMAGGRDDDFLGDWLNF